MANWQSNWLLMRYAIGGIFVALIFGYALFRSWDLLVGPELIIKSPTNGEVSKNGIIQVTGEAERIASLYLNGRQIFTDEAGAFKETLLLLPGYNIIVVEAKDKFGRQAAERLALINQK